MARSTAHLIAGAFAAAWLGIAQVVLAADLKITGVPEGGDLFKALGAGSLLAEQVEQVPPPTTQEVVAAAQADYGRLLAVLYDEGYFGPVIKITLDGVEAARIPPVNPPGRITFARISVTPGPKFTFGAARISPVAPETALPDGFAAGQTARVGVLKDTVAAGIEGWRDQGHAKARLAAQQLAARHAAQKIDATLRLAPGPRLRFGPLSVAGESAVRTQRILEIAALPEGRVFSPVELRRAQTRLRRTGAFNAAALIEADQIGPDATLPISAQITDAPPRRFGFGAEVSTVEGLTLSAFWMHRNLLGGAERLRLEAEVSGIGGGTGGSDHKLSARFERPATFNADTDFYALGLIEQRNEPNFFSRSFEAEAGIERLANENRTYRLGLGLRRAETRDIFGTNRFTLLTLPLGATFDYRDDKLDAKDGYYIDAGLTPFLALSGADNGLRGLVDARYYRTFGNARPVTLALRGQLGSVYGPALSVAPADYLFYSGGGGTVRGQPFQSLGVDLGGGNTVGGRSFVAIAAEARVKVTDTIGIVGFADAGYVGAEQFYDGTGDWHSGAGFGLRYATGLGPIRLDLAVPTSGPDTGEDYQIYIGIGQAF